MIETRYSTGNFDFRRQKLSSRVYESTRTGDADRKKKKKRFKEKKRNKREISL